MAVVGSYGEAVHFIRGQVVNSHSLVNGLSHARVGQQVARLRHVDLLVGLPSEHSRRPYFLLETILVVLRVEGRHFEGDPVKASAYQNGFSAPFGLFYELPIV